MQSDLIPDFGESPGPIRAQAVSGLAWMGGARIATQILDQIFTIILVRLLAPDDFGLIAMTAVFTSLVRLFADMGLGPAIIQRAEIDEEYLSTAFWGNFAFGLMLCAFVAAGALPVSRFFGQPQLASMLVALSLRFVFAGTTATQEAILTRQMKFASLVSRDVTSLAIGGVIGVGMALAGLGAWSLVGQALGVFVSRGLLIWTVTPWRPRRRFSWAKFRELWDFGSRVLGARFFTYTIKQTDNMLIGRTLGPTLLGYYAYAYGLFLAPLANISQVLGRVTFSAFSRLQRDDDRFRRAFLLTTKLLGAVSIPAIAGLMLVAPEMIAVVFGRKWLPAVPVLRVLLVAGLLQSQVTVWMSVFQAKGRADWMLRWAVVSACLYVPAFFVGIRWGIVGVAAGYLLSTVLLVPVLLSLIRRLVGFALREYLAVLAPVVAATAIMALCVLGLNASLLHVGIGPVVRLGASVVAGVLSYVVLLILVQRDLIAEMLQMVFELRRPRRRLTGKPVEV